jgi:calcineurin-like phosphoesterase
MTGPYDSVIGVQKEQIVQRFLTGLPARFEAATNDARFCAVLVECDPQSGRARSVQRIMIDGTGNGEYARCWEMRAAGVKK